MTERKRKVYFRRSPLFNDHQDVWGERLTLPFHAFLSYSHEDGEIAKSLYDWLTDWADYEIWFDSMDLKNNAPVAADLPRQMQSCRGWILLASHHASESTWVEHESTEAIHRATEDPDFQLIVLRIDDSDVGDAWPHLKKFRWIDMPGGILTPAIARELIDRLDGRVWAGRQSGLRDIFVSRGWQPRDKKFADAVCRGLCAPQWQLRLIGDARDQPHFEHERVRRILSNCRGHVVILPLRGSDAGPTDHDYRYLLREMAISRDLDMPVLVLAEPETPLPESLEEIVCRVSPNSDFHRSWLKETPEWLDDFLDTLIEPPEPQHVFFAAEYRGQDNRTRISSLREIIEAITGLPCLVGRDFEGQGLRDTIGDSISFASVVVANIANFLDPAPDDDLHGVNLNTCIEAGVAYGASRVRVAKGEEPSEIFLLARSADGDRGRIRRLPFMFGDTQIRWYSDDVEQIGLIHRLLYGYRRRVMNFEFL